MNEPEAKQKLAFHQRQHPRRRASFKNQEFVEYYFIF